MEKNDKKLILSILCFAILWTLLCFGFIYVAIQRIVEIANI